MADYQHGVPILITDTFRVAGVETNPTAIVYTIRAPDGSTDIYNWPGDPEVTNTGVGTFELALSPPSLPGLYVYDVDSTGTVVASRSGSFNILANAVTGPDVSWPVPGPCGAWTSTQAAWSCCGQPTVTVDGDVCPVDFAPFVQMASEVLFELSGRLFVGQCEKTVRPCRAGNPCGIQVLSRGHVVGPWDWGGGWGSWTGSGWSDPSYCGCHPLDRVKLSGYPVREITEVKIDGDVVDPDTYRLDGWRWLVRTRDVAEPDVSLFWPSCQILDLPDTEDGTFSVTYRYGQDPPVSGQHAAAALACQFYQACDGGGDDCEVPSTAVRVTRQGVTIDKTVAVDWFLERKGIRGWKTGIVAVDGFLNSVNPNTMQRRPITWSPDGQRYAKQVGQ